MVYPPESFNVQTWWLALKTSVCMCVCEKPQRLFVISHTMKTAGLHQCNSRQVRFVCWGVVKGKCWRTVFKSETDRGGMSECVWYCDRMRVRCCEACWLRWRKGRLSFWSKLVLLPFLWHPHNSRWQDQLPLTATFCWLPSHHTKHTNTPLHWLTVWCQMLFGKPTDPINQGS